MNETAPSGDLSPAVSTVGCSGFLHGGSGAASPQQQCSDLLQRALPRPEHCSLSGTRNLAAVLLGRLSGSKMPLSRLKWSWAAPAASQKAFKASRKSQRILAQRLWRSPEEGTQTPFAWCAHPYREGMEVLRHALGKDGNKTEKGRKQD